MIRYGGCRSLPNRQEVGWVYSCLRGHKTVARISHELHIGRGRVRSALRLLEYQGKAVQASEDPETWTRVVE